MGFKSFFKELKRRNIYKVAVVYAITAWVLVQVASVATETFGAPPWVMKMIITIILLGFPITLVITWAFEVTPEGIRKTTTDSDGRQLSERTFWIGMVLVTALLFGGWWYMNNSETTSQLPNPDQITDRSIAVLPFTNHGGEGKADPLARGIHDDLLTRLSNISDLKVISRTSVENFKGTDLNVPAIADSLGVRWILEGGVLEVGGQVKVNAQLIDPKNDSHIWAKDYQRKLSAENFFAIQGNITREIANALKAQLSPGEQERIAGAPTQNLEAYRLYAKGRRLIVSRQPDSLARAIDQFERVLKRDSTFSLAWAGLSDAMVLHANYNNTDSLPAVLPEAEIAAQRALELAPNLAEAHASRAIIYMYEQLLQNSRSNGMKAWQHLQKAIQLKPSYSQAHHWLGEILLPLGRPERAYEHLSLALELSPGNQSARQSLTIAQVATNRYKEALLEAQSFKTKYPNESGYILEASVLIHQKRWEEFWTLIRKQSNETEGSPRWAVFLKGLVNAATGDTRSAKDCIQELNLMNKDVEAALVYAATNEVDFAFQNLPGYESLLLKHIYTIRYFFPDLLEAFRQDNRYEELIKQMNTDWGLNPDGSIPEEYESKFST